MYINFTEQQDRDMYGPLFSGSRYKWDDIIRRLYSSDNGRTTIDFRNMNTICYHTEEETPDNLIMEKMLKKIELILNTKRMEVPAYYSMQKPYVIGYYTSRRCKPSFTGEVYIGLRADTNEQNLTSLYDWRVV